MDKQPRYVLKECNMGYQIFDTVVNVPVCTGQIHGIMMGICDIMNSTEGGSNVVF